MALNVSGLSTGTGVVSPITVDGPPRNQIAAPVVTKIIDAQDCDTAAYEVVAPVANVVPTVIGLQLSAGAACTAVVESLKLAWLHKRRGFILLQELK